jgi:RHO1 GDP-GTP exchange protein 1/2
MSHANTTNEPLTSEVFQVATLRSDTFIIQSMPANQSRGRESTFSGKVNCSLSFSRRKNHLILIWTDLLISTVLASTDGRACLAVGCEEGLWIGYRDDSQREVCAPRVRPHCCSGSSITALRHVSDLNLKKVTQCAMLEQFGIFLVLADKVKQHLLVPQYAS